MVFNSVVFIAFFGVVLVLYWSLPHRFRNHFLICAGYFFYGYWDYRFLGLLLASTVMDYLLGRRIHRISDDRQRRWWVVLSVVVNLAFLGFFKYFNFFTENAHALLQALGLSTSMTVLKIVLPVGISFYTFQSMAYVIDIYRRKAQPAHNFIEYAAYVAFFPQLVAGPIERPAHLLTQFSLEKSFSLQRLIAGIELMVWGFFKKMFIADNVSLIADHVFSTPATNQTGLQVLLGIYAFAIQIYCDFSGYSDIARGTARCIGFELVVNFRCPYLATNPSEFWQRWHISLSTWLRDHLYIPLGGNRHGAVQTYRNLMITMALGGLWHGAAWTFVLWGVFHGLLLVAYRLLERPAQARPPAPHLLARVGWFVRVVVFFHFVCFGWLLFRAADMTQVVEMCSAIVHSLSAGVTSLYYVKSLVFYGWFAVLAESVWFYRERWLAQTPEMPRLGRTSFARAALSAFAVSSVLLFGAFESRSFIYFQF